MQDGSDSLDDAQMRESDLLHESHFKIFLDIEALRDPEDVADDVFCGVSQAPQVTQNPVGFLDVPVRAMG